MEEDSMLESENRKIKEESFIERQRLKEYNSNNYLICTLRFSIIEKVLTKYLFQNSGQHKEYSLYQLSKDLAKDSDSKSLFLSFCQMFIEKFGQESPLYFFNQISKELIRLFKAKDLSKIQFDDYILKLEFLLAWHFESNFYPRVSILEIIESLNDNLYLSNGITNFIYSIESINTIEHFLEAFERQSLCTRIDGDLDLINNLFCCEKVYYFYCDKMNKKKIMNGNMIKYLLQQLNTKISKNKNSKINSLDIENYIMINLYLIDKILQNYTFYLYKDPELVEIFDSLEKFKTWPSPISIFCNRVIENIINENYFQGISLLNKLRQAYYLDLIDNDITSIETNMFKYTLVIYSKEWEKRHEKDKNNFFDIKKFINYLKGKPCNKHNKKLILKEILIKLLITIIFNSDQNFNDDTFRKLYSAYLPNYTTIYDDNNSSINNDKVKASLDKLFKVIDVGFDKTISDFSDEINLCAKKIISSINSVKISDKNKKGDNIFENDFYLPINSMRNYLKPNFTEFKTIYKDDNNNKEEQDIVNIFDSYINNFTKIVNTYFGYFLSTPKDPIVANNLNTMRKNFFNSYHINILLFEEENTINYLIENLQNKIFSVLDTKISESDFNNFWKYFVEDKKEIIPKFLLYVVPYYERSTSNPFRLLTEENSLKNKETYLSEFIANHDYIYKNIIFMPFSSACDGPMNNCINKSPEKTNDFMREPPISTLLSPLKKSLNYYLGDSNGIFNLDLYQVTINDKVIQKVFFKNIEILDIINEGNKKTKLTMTCVDSLGVEDKEVKEIIIGNNFDIKIFNLFYKNNVPFNYNINSNNGWLEMFLDDKYDIEEVDRFCNFQNFLQYNKESKFYEEFNMPQTDIETRFTNYKIKSILIESNSPTIIIRSDDYMDINYGEKVDLRSSTSTKTGNSDNELKLKIKIEPYLVNDQRYSIPIATFTTI
jgi:transcriptional regulator NrdR family protein